MSNKSHKYVNRLIKLSNKLIEELRREEEVNSQVEMDFADEVSTLYNKVLKLEKDVRNWQIVAGVLLFLLALTAVAML